MLVYYFRYPSYSIVSKFQCRSSLEISIYLILNTIFILHACKLSNDSSVISHHIIPSLSAFSVKVFNFSSTRLNFFFTCDRRCSLFNSLPRWRISFVANLPPPCTNLAATFCSFEILMAYMYDNYKTGVRSNQTKQPVRGRMFWVGRR